LKGKLEGMNKMVQAELDKTVYVHRVQFETEFKALSDIWNKVSTARAALAGLRPHFEIIPFEPHTELVRMDMFEGKFRTFATASGQLREAAHNQSPFYTREIYAEILRIIDTFGDEEAQLKLTDDAPFTAAWYKRGEQNWTIALNTADRISEMIRDRIKSLSLYRE